ncbi:type II secretion system minor pseudopilin GspJ [Vibrio genomosp. F10]|uniref:type II secretion system minor pseudopilin GspJ n=1 Tax=Vibrio genomosp. F10 TaxID=723171 RepID=UPI0003823DE0|nr:type II secretion system minor pseudopilin GspJ [Vibrio genomosp. F10]OEF04623.1 type II secretion system protein GspJ [Vibrio genomosp. F10 str. 9ZD137]
MFLSKVMFRSKAMSLNKMSRRNRFRSNVSCSKQNVSRSTQIARKAQQGFTLLEVLIAMAIFAALSVSAYQVVDQVRMSNAISLERGDRLKELQRSLVVMDSDFRQMATRQFRTNGEAGGELSEVQLLQWKDYLLESDGKGVLFTRLGWHNPQQQFPRGETLKVGYRIKETTLERVWWRYPDTPAGQQPIITPILTDVESFSMRFYSKGTWSDKWEAAQTLPEAVALELELTDYAKIERVYLVASGEIVLSEDDQEDRDSFKSDSSDDDASSDEEGSDEPSE